PKVGPTRTLLARAVAVPPVITVRKAAARPPHNRRLQALHVVHQCGSDTAVVPHFGLLAHPNAIVNHAADVLGEMAVKVRRNYADGFFEQDFDARFGFRRAGAPGSEEGQARKRSVLDEVAAR